MCNADVKLGDLLIHEGSAKHAQKFAAKVFNADKTYFVLNGTSAANKVVTNALLTAAIWCCSIATTISQTITGADPCGSDACLSGSCAQSVRLYRRH